jgi:3,5-dihydroxyphenylacetyl-CoA synthase
MLTSTTEKSLCEVPGDHAAEGQALTALLLGIGTATPSTSYSQAEILDIFEIKDTRIRSLFMNSSIDQRHLNLPEFRDDGRPQEERQGDLLRKHRRCAIELGSAAIRACLEPQSFTLSDVAYLCCVTSTGFLTPGVSALLCRELGLPKDVRRLDVVGMGCNAGLNALNATSNWALADPGRLAVVLCVEVCSAGYVFDGSMRTAVVNSLFGDGAAAAAIVAEDAGYAPLAASIVKYDSCLITGAMDAMRYDWDTAQNKFSFFLDPQIPYVIGAHIEEALAGLLAGTGLRRSDISHWIIHSGGKKVIDAIKVNLGLSPYDLRHTTSILKSHGNLSSGSFLFSYERLLLEQRVEPGDYGVMITMGPGTTIESALVRW